MTRSSPAVPIPPEPPPGAEPDGSTGRYEAPEPPELGESAGPGESAGQAAPAGPGEPAELGLEAAAPPGPPPAWWSALDSVLRVAAGVIVAVATALSATLELLLATIRVGGHLIGVSVLLAVAANTALSWFAHRAVGAGWAVSIPALVWFGLMVVAAGGTAEGDILLAGNNWVGLGMIVAGSMAFAVVGFRLILGPRR